VSNVKDYYVYILSSGRRGTLYIGVTNDLARRVYEHKSDAIPGFTQKYGVKDLVWYEVHQSIEGAIQREKSLKRWYRDWKIDLVETENPDWRDLYQDLA
jgi:putative endonuclease